jgi:hypothetical protein
MTYHRQNARGRNRYRMFCSRCDWGSPWIDNRLPYAGNFYTSLHKEATRHG